jgi:hypothetical protein
MLDGAPIPDSLSVLGINYINQVYHFSSVFLVHGFDKESQLIWVTPNGEVRPINYETIGDFLGDTSGQEARNNFNLNFHHNENDSRILLDTPNWDFTEKDSTLHLYHVPKKLNHENGISLSEAEVLISIPKLIKYLADNPAKNEKKEASVKKVVGHLKLWDSAMNTTEGGIDLNSKNLQMDVNGEKIDIKFDPAMIVQFKSGDFSGVTPVIINITPISNVMSLLGLKEEDGRFAGA